MRRHSLTIIFLLSVAGALSAQQDPLTSHYMYSVPSFNPAAAGSSGMVCATAINRQQWVGLDGAPSTTTFSVNTPLRLFRSQSGAGLKIRSDKAGFDSDIGIDLSYSLFLSLGTGRLGIGISGGVLNKTLNPKWVIPAGDIYVPPSGDPLIPEGKESFVAFDAGMGIFYKADRYFAGLSVTHLNQPVIRFSKGNPYLSRHYYLTAGYNLVLANPAFELQPSVLMFSDGRIFQTTLNTIVLYNKKAWGGVSYRSGDAITGMAGIELANGIKLGYAYDFSLTDIRKNTSGSHEFMVRYCFELSAGRSPMRYKSVRFL